MAATRASEVATNVTTASTTWNVNVGSPTAGQLLIVGVRFAAAPGAVTFTGYTVLAGPDTSDAADDTTIIYYRWADGTEGTTDTLSPTNSVKGGAVCFLFNGAENPATRAPEISSVQNFTTTANTADPNTVTPTGGTKNYALCAIAGMDGESTTFSALSGYTNFVNGNSGTSGLPATNCIIGGATRTAQVSSENPGAFTHGAAQTGGSSWVVAIHPAALVGASVVSLTTSFTTAGTVYSPPETLYGASVVALASTFTTQAKVTRSGASVVALTCSLTTQGRRVAFGSSTASFVFDATTSGVGSGADTLYGASVLPLTLALTSAGYRSLLAHPTADSVDGAWTNQAGGSDLEGAIDEPGYDDADYIRSELNPAASACRVKLESLPDPGSSSGHILRWRIGKDAAAGVAVDMKLTLRQGGGDTLGGGTQIAQFTRADVSDAFTTYAETLSGAQADAITDYSDLYLEFEATAV